MDVRREERWAGGGGHGREHASTSTYRHGDRHGRGGGGRGSRRDVRSHGRFQPARGSSSRWSKPSSHVVVNWTRQERQALYLAANCRFGLRLGAAGDGAGGPGSPGSGAGPGAGSGSGGRFSLGFDWDDDVVFLEIDVVRDKETENWGRDEENSRVTSSALLCPISLDTLELPFMTPCGHVFSLVSLVTDMVVREGSWESLGSLGSLGSGGPRCRLSGPCPMCGVEVAARELKPVRVRVVERVERNGVGRWRLMRRRGGEGDGEACAVGGENESESENKKANKKANKKTNSTDSSNRGIRQVGVMHVDALEGVFGSRMYVENPEVLYRYVVCRLAARSEEVAEEGGAESGCRYLGYLTAIDVVVEMAKRMMGEEEGGQVGRRLREDVGGVIAWCRGEVARVRRQARLDEEFPSLDGSGSAGKESMVDIERLTVRCRSGTSGKDVVKTEGPGKRVSETPETSYFYQSADGQRVFLNALNTEMLREAGYPPVVAAKVLDVEMFEQTMATKATKAMKATTAGKGAAFLANVPLGASVGICEVDLSGVVSEEVMEKFRDEIDRKRDERERKAKTAFLENQRREKEALKANQAAADAVTAMMRSMPRLGGGGNDVDDGGGGDVVDNVDDGRFPSDPNTPSWAILAKEGFAATGPSLGGSPSTNAVVPPSTSWGASMASPASSSWMPDLETLQRDAGPKAAGGKGKKKVMLLSSSANQRRY